MMIAATNSKKSELIIHKNFFSPEFKEECALYMSPCDVQIITVRKFLKHNLAVLMAYSVLFFKLFIYFWGGVESKS